jgi:hypothetical protein
MEQKAKINVEGGEIFICNTHGDCAVIPKKDVEKVKRLIKEKCFDCIDNYVSTLPRYSDYAEDGTLIPKTDKPLKKSANSNTTEPKQEEKSSSKNLTLQQATNDPPQWLKYQEEYIKNNPFNIDKYVETRFNNPVGIEIIEKAIDKEGWREKLKKEALEKRQKDIMDYVTEQIVKNKPQGNLSRGEWLNQMSKEEEEFVTKNPKYQTSLWQDLMRGLISITEKSPAQAIINILNSPDYSNREKEKLIAEYAEHPILSKLMDALKVFSPAEVLSKMVQSAYKDGYSLSDAIKGKKNEAGIIEDIVTDPLNLVGIGAIAKLSKAGKLPKLDDVVKGLNKEKNIVKEISKEKGLEEVSTKADEALEDLSKTITDTKEVEMKNAMIVKEGSKYFEELNNPESLKRLKEFGEEYKIDLLGAYKKAAERWKKNLNIGGHDRFKVAGDEIFKEDLKDAMAYSTYDDVGILKFIFFDNKGDKLDLSKHSINYMNKKTDIGDYHTIVWHELSHDINKHIIENSPKLKREIEEIFIDDVSKLSDRAIIDARNKANALYKTNFVEKNKKIDLEEINPMKYAKEQLDYIKDPTEFWAFLSTNLRQDLKNTGLIKDYNQVLTREILEKAIKNGNTVFSRFEPYIKDKDKFINLYNKMTLAIAPAVVYLETNKR